MADIQPWHFLGHYLRRHLGVSAIALVAVISGASCAVGAQYSLKLLIDRMSAATPTTSIVPLAADVALFLGLLGAESGFWRLGGWLGSRAIIRIGADIRLDLFDRVIGQSWRFFANQTSGALSGRIPAAAKAATTVLSTLMWNIVPPCADLIGSIVVLMTIDWHLAAALLVAILVLTAMLRFIGAQGFPLHRAYHAESAAVLGEISDVIANIGLLHAFDSRRREADRMRQKVNAEAASHSRSWT